MLRAQALPDERDLSPIQGQTEAGGPHPVGLCVHGAVRGIYKTIRKEEQGPRDERTLRRA